MKSWNQVIGCLCATRSPIPSCPRKAVRKRLESTVADTGNQQPVCLLSARVSARCSALPQKSSHSACTQRFKPCVAHGENLRGFLPSTHTSAPAVEHYSTAPGWPIALGDAKYALSNVLQEGERSLPGRPRRSPHCSLS